MPSLVLVVDDDRDLAALTALLIREAGHEAVIAHSGAAALALAESRRPDAMLLDIRMPDMDGFEVNRLLKARSGGVDIPVIFLSANVQESARREAFESGVRFFLPKPSEQKDLLAAIGSVLPDGLSVVKQDPASI
jgi:CheY-like chemotaxis protein